MAINARIKLAFCIVLLVITAVAAALIPALYFFSDMLEQEQERAAIQGVNGLHTIIEEYKMEAVHYATVLSKYPALVQSVEGKDMDELFRLLGQMREDAGVDFITITDARGIVMIRSHELRQGDNLSHLADVKAAMEGTIQANLEPGTVIRLAIRAAAPLKNEQGRTVGVISLGYDATRNEIVDRVKDMFHTEATLFLGDERVSTTIVKDGERVVGTKLNKNVADTVLGEKKPHLGRAEILGTDYMTAYLPIMGVDGKPVGALFAGESLADFLATRNKIVMIVGFIILCLLTVVIFLTTNRLHRELEEAKIALEQMVLSRTEQLRKSHSFTELVLENIPDAIFVKDAKTLRYIRVNRATETLLEYSRDELMGKNNHDLFGVEEADKFAITDLQALETGKLVDIPEDDVYIRNKGIRWLHTKKIPIVSEQGIPEYLLGISSDITQVKRTAGALKETAREKRLLLDSTLDMIIYHDLDLKVVWANRRAETEAQQSVAEVKGCRCWNVWYDRAEPCLGCPISLVRDTGLPQEAELTSPDGRDRFIRGYPIRNDEGNMIGIAEFCSDMTDQKRAERALRESEARYRAVVETQTDCIYRCTPEGELIFVNDAFSRFYNVQKEMVIGLSLAALLELEGLEPLYEQRSVLTSDNPIEISQMRYVTPEGSVRWIEYITQGFFDNRGNLTEYQAVGRDMTAQREAEAAMSEAREASERASRVITLAVVGGGIAHEINQPLNSIRVLAETTLLLCQRNDTMNKIMQSMRDVSGQVDRIDAIVNHLRSLMGTNQRYEQVPCQMNDVVESSLSYIANQLFSRCIKVKTELMPCLPFVNGSLVRFEEVILNLLMNAMQALDNHDRQGKEIVIRTWADEYVNISVSDNGPGIDPEFCDRIFEPFFTTKKVGNSMGLGLSIVESIVSSRNGTIQMKNKEDGGTLIQVSLPKIANEYGLVGVLK